MTTAEPNLPEDAFIEAGVARARALGVEIDAAVEAGLEQNLRLLWSHHRVILDSLDEAE